MVLTWPAQANNFKNQIFKASVPDFFVFWHNFKNYRTLKNYGIY